MAAMMTGTLAKESHPFDSSKKQREFFEDTVAHLRSVLLSSKAGLTPKQILYDYLYLVGSPIPYRILGYKDIVHFLESLPNVCELSWENGKPIYRAKATATTHHIWRLVTKQKSPTQSRRPSKRLSCSNESEGCPASAKRYKNDNCSPDRNRAPSSRRPDVISSFDASSPPPPSADVSSRIDEALAFRGRPRHQRSRSRLAFASVNDYRAPPSKIDSAPHPIPRRRGRSLSSLPIGTDRSSAEVVSSSTRRHSKFPRSSTSNPRMVTSTPRRSTSEIPVPEDIRINLLRILGELPKGVLVRDLPDLYSAKFKRQLPTFLAPHDALTAFLECLTGDVLLTKHPSGTSTVRLRGFPADRPLDVGVVSLKNHVTAVVRRVLEKRPRGIFLTRLSFEFRKEERWDIPLERLGFANAFEFVASMPHLFDLRPASTQPGVKAELILSLARDPR